MDKNKKEISWEAPEHIHYEKGLSWYLVAALIALAFFAYAFWQKDYLMFATLFVVLAAGFFVAHKRPNNISISLNHKGLVTNDVLYRYDTTLKSFWIVYHPPETKTLYFQTAQLFNQTISVELADQNPVEIREFLLQYLPEDLEREESNLDRILRLIKF
ncbi:MAG: hypothetical protein HY397_01575 [Candidatus Doudnabacteria bacterium]|nr:hypothetical protein [Candidatus Doudnabacteria bacterium]